VRLEDARGAQVPCLRIIALAQVDAEKRHAGTRGDDLDAEAARAEHGGDLVVQ
jgi:hypothetical protein